LVILDWRNANNVNYIIMPKYAAKGFLIQFFEIMYSTTFVIILNSSFYIQKVDGVN
jgi:hypothetical protein